MARGRPCYAAAVLCSLLVTTSLLWLSDQRRLIQPQNTVCPSESELREGGGIRPPEPEVEAVCDHKRVRVSECGCEKSVPWHFGGYGENERQSVESGRNEGTCSQDVWELGSGQKVLGFTYFQGDAGGDVYQRDYFSGIRKDAEKMTSRPAHS